MGAVRYQGVGTGGRLEVERGDGGGMHSSVDFAKVFGDAEKCVDKEIAEDCIDADHFVDMGFGVGVRLFNGVEMWGSGADMGHSSSNDDAHDYHDDSDSKTIDQ